MEKSRAIELLEHLAWDRDIERNPYGDALNMAIEALKAQLSCEGTTSDLISRQAAIDALNFGAEYLRLALDATDIVGVERDKYRWGLGLIESYIADVKELPTIQPERAEGHWINGKCDRCGEHAPFWAMASTYHESNYCPNCGAKMKGVKRETD